MCNKLMPEVTKGIFRSRNRPEIRYSFLPAASRVTPQTADTGAVKTASMSWLGPLNIWNKQKGQRSGARRHSLNLKLLLSILFVLP